MLMLLVMTSNRALAQDMDFPVDSPTPEQLRLFNEAYSDFGGPRNPDIEHVLNLRVFRDHKIVLLSGPSGSGKSFLAEKLTRYATQLGLSVGVVKLWPNNPTTYEMQVVEGGKPLEHDLIVIDGVAGRLKPSSLAPGIGPLDAMALPGEPQPLDVGEFFNLMSLVRARAEKGKATLLTSAIVSLGTYMRELFPGGAFSSAKAAELDIKQGRLSLRMDLISKPDCDRHFLRD